MWLPRMKLLPGVMHNVWGMWFMHPESSTFDAVCSDDWGLALSSNRAHSCIVWLELPFEEWKLILLVWRSSNRLLFPVLVLLQGIRSVQFGQCTVHQLHDEDLPSPVPFDLLLCFKSPLIPGNTMRGSVSPRPTATSNLFTCLLHLVSSY